MRFDQLSGKRVGIFGMGVEGKSAVRILEKYTSYTTLVEIEESSLSLLNTCDVLIKSPGVSLYRSEIQEFVKNGGLLTSGTNLFFANKRPEQQIIAVTGTKGKSTTSALMAHTLNCLNIPTALGGNIGVPLLDLLDVPQNICVAELSSYQCADLSYDPDFGILTNLYPEHLQWHGSHRQYFSDKLNMIRRSKKRLINIACPRVIELQKDLTDCLTFNDLKHIHVESDYFMDGSRQLFKISSLNLRGEHNAQNACAVLSILSLFNIPLEFAEKPFSLFQALDHRLQVFHVSNDTRTYVDDSISTTPETAVAGLKAFDRGQFLTLIAGGLDRGQDYSVLIEYLRSVQDRCLLLTLPETGGRISQCAERSGIQNISCLTMSQAVEKAKKYTPDDGLILLSPAAPSYNMYRNFKERGKDFQRLAGVMTI